LLFWPIWERQRFPSLLAKALRANAGYVRLLGERLAGGGGYDSTVIAAKRAVELANSVVFTSLQRMSADPKNQQVRFAESAALANGNQRLTRALTVVALHLAPAISVDRSEIARFIELATHALEKLAFVVETESTVADQLNLSRHELDQLALGNPKGSGTVEHGLYRQFARCATELSAMLIAALPTSANNVDNSLSPDLPNSGS